jgi:hypothetical protein
MIIKQGTPKRKISVAWILKSDLHPKRDAP